MSRRGHARRLAFAALLGAGLLGPTHPHARQPAYFPDDPIASDPETQDASRVKPRDISGAYDFLENTFVRRGEDAPRRALNVNTIDEVPDSSWFANRAGARPLGAAEIRRGPDTTNGPAPGAWTIISGKSDGITPGFTIRDTAGLTWFIKFDPPSNPEMATGAEMVSTKLFWALGFHVPENHLATLRREALAIDPKARIRDIEGRRRSLTSSDVDRLLGQGARRDDGTFRVIASRAVAGTPVGPFQYFGTRPDDPNDIHPHEHRRELRGLRAFAAWLNHDDSRSLNSLDTLVERQGRTVLWHYLIDFGSTLGSGSVHPQKARAGNEYIWEPRPTVLTALTLGLWVRPWMRVQYPDIRSLGNIEATFFQPAAWRPEYPNAAFDHAQPDDLFWAARKVMAIDDEAIAAAVEMADYSDPRASAYLREVIAARRDKIGRAWLTHVNPVVDLALAADGTLTFRNIAVDAVNAREPDRYGVQWARFDNATGTATDAGPVAFVTASPARMPQALGEAAFVEARIAAVSSAYPAWAEPVVARFRRVAGGWSLVGVRRGPEPGATAPSP